jgi:hypothetical protein
MSCATIIRVAMRAVQQQSKAAPLQTRCALLFPPQMQPLGGLSFQLCGHGMGRAALAAGRVILVKDTTLRCFVESRSIYTQLGFYFALVSSGNRRIQLFLLRFDSGEYRLVLQGTSTGLP